MTSEKRLAQLRLQILSELGSPCSREGQMMEGGSEFRSYVVCNLRITRGAVETVPHKSRGGEMSLKDQNYSLLHFRFSGYSDFNKA